MATSEFKLESSLGDIRAAVDTYLHKNVTLEARDMVLEYLALAIQIYGDKCKVKLVIETLPVVSLGAMQVSQTTIVRIVELKDGSCLYRSESSRQWMRTPPPP